MNSSFNVNILIWCVLHTALTYSSFVRALTIGNTEELSGTKRYKIFTSSSSNDELYTKSDDTLKIYPHMNDWKLESSYKSDDNRNDVNNEITNSILSSISTINLKSGLETNTTTEKMKQVDFYNSDLTSSDVQKDLELSSRSNIEIALNSSIILNTIKRHLQKTDHAIFEVAADRRNNWSIDEAQSGEISEDDTIQMIPSYEEQIRERVNIFDVFDLTPMTAVKSEQLNLTSKAHSDNYIIFGAMGPTTEEPDENSHKISSGLVVSSVVGNLLIVMVLVAFCRICKQFMKARSNDTSISPDPNVEMKYVEREDVDYQSHFTDVRMPEKYKSKKSTIAYGAPDTVLVNSWFH